MATLEEVDDTAVNGSDQERPAQEDPAEEQPPDRRRVDALLHMSEEDFMNELEPYEYHCQSGWEEAVHGWARVAPLSSILLNQKKYRKPKNKEADSQAPSSVDPTIPTADISASSAEHHCESHVGPHNSLKKSTRLNQQHTGSCSNTAVAALQINFSEWPVHNAMHKTTSDLSVKEKTEEERTLRETPVQNRPTKPQKHSQRPNNTVVPIKNFTFLPPIKSPHLNPQRLSGQLGSGNKVPEGETMEENGFMFNKKSGTRGTRVDPVSDPELPTYSAALTSKYRTCQHNPHLFSAVSVSIPKGYQVPMSSKPDTVHRTRYLGKSLTQALHPSSTVAGTQTRIRPSKTVYSLNLYEGCKVNV